MSHRTVAHDPAEFVFGKTAKKKATDLAVEPKTGSFAETGFPWDDGDVKLATCFRCGSVIQSNGDQTWCPSCER